MTDRIKSLLIYAGKVATGTISVFTLSSLFQYADVGWCLISVMLVLSPDGRDSLTLAVTRIKANLVGVPCDPDQIPLGGRVRLVTFVAGADDDGTEAVAFGFTPQEGD